jgi:hypothetical protein
VLLDDNDDKGGDDDDWGKFTVMGEGGDATFTERRARILVPIDNVEVERPSRTIVVMVAEGVIFDILSIEGRARSYCCLQYN